MKESLEEKECERESVKECEGESVRVKECEGESVRERERVKERVRKKERVRERMTQAAALYSLALSRWRSRCYYLRCELLLLLPLLLCGLLSFSRVARAPREFEFILFLEG